MSRVVRPLIGSSAVPEELVTRLDAFDCVTYAESVLALGWSPLPAWKFSSQIGRAHV